MCLTERDFYGKSNSDLHPPPWICARVFKNLCIRVSVLLTEWRMRSSVLWWKRKSGRTTEGEMECTCLPPGLKD